MLVLWATGHLEWSLYATFGAFTSLFGRAVPIRARLLMQVQAGGVLVASVLIGTLIAVLGSTVPGAGRVVVPVAAVWAAAVAILSHRLRWHPPGPLFPLFALGACSSVPAGPGLPPVAVAVAAAATLCALLLTACTAKFESGGPAPAPEWTLSHYLVRYAAGVAVAGAVATAVGHPYWAMVAAVVPMSAPDAAGRLTRAAQRLAGTLVGVVIAWALLTAGAAPAGRHRGRGAAPGRRRAVRGAQLRRGDAVHHAARAVDDAPREPRARGRPRRRPRPGHAGGRRRRRGDHAAHPGARRRPGPGLIAPPSSSRTAGAMIDAMCS
jgi:hypothetical protein